MKGLSDELDPPEPERRQSIEHINSQVSKCDQQRKQPWDDLLKLLQSDPHELVRAEAQLIKQYSDAQSLDFDSRRRRHRELRPLKKQVLTWGHVESHLLSDHRFDDYTILELEQFAEKLPAILSKNTN